MAAAAALRVYYLGEPLSPEECAEVCELVGRDVEQVRIPSVFPAPDPVGGYSDRPLMDADAAARPLERAGIRSDAGSQVGLVAPTDSHWCSALMEAIRLATGFLPFLIQTETQRRAIRNPGALRIVDAHGLGGRLR